MRLTRLGALIILAAGVTFCGALISANNLLYLVFSLLVSSLLLSVWLNVRNLARLSFRARPPDQVFRDKPFDLELEVRNEKGRPAFQVHVVSEGVRHAVDRLAGRGSAVVTVPAVCTRLGRNALEALTVESGYPFGFFWGRRKVRGLVVTAYPAVYDLYGRETAATLCVGVQFVLFGIPTAILGWRLGRITLLSSTIAGFLIGCIPYLLILPFDQSFGPDYLSTIQGILRAAGTFLAMGALGAFEGLLFWLVWRLLSWGSQPAKPPENVPG